MLKKIFLSLLSIILFSIPVNANDKGALVIIGGGERPDYIIKKIVDLAGGKNAKILIIPMASSIAEEVGKEQKKEFEKYSPSSVEYLIFENKNADNSYNIQKIKEATGIFFSGGDQNKLIKSLKNTKFFEYLKDIYYKKSGVISGTSAGAAVMSKIMITGNELKNKENEFNSIMKNNVETSEGFGFVENIIIDQHFIKRKRQNRLLSISLENPNISCVGIDESTSIIVKDSNFQVLGESIVQIYDSSLSKNISNDKNGNYSVENIKVHLLKSGQIYDFNNKKIINKEEKND